MNWPLAFPRKEPLQIGTVVGMYGVIVGVGFLTGERYYWLKDRSPSW
jgi:hypothetical protein